jgi:ATP-dependent phosphofructokinase / diphosphate-dependent phosphofructokinase
MILIPEVPTTVDDVIAAIESRRARGRDFAIVVVSEGFELALGEEPAGERDVDEFGHAQLAKIGVGQRLADELGRRTGLDTRATVLGHVQRGGTPNADDRILATRFGTRAAELVADGRFGRMVSLQGDDIVDVPLADAVGELKLVPPERYALAVPFFG